MCSSNVFRITQALSILYFMCGATFIGWPIISYVLFGKMEPSCPIFLPWVNFDTNIGFVINWIYHIYMLTLATFGFIFCDALYADSVFHVHMMSNLIAKHWNFLNIQMKERNLTDLEVKLLFRNLCYMHQEMTTWVECTRLLKMSFFNFYLWWQWIGSLGTWTISTSLWYLFKFFPLQLVSQ